MSMWAIVWRTLVAFGVLTGVFLAVALVIRSST